MPIASGSIAYLGAARFQGFWNATTNNATGSGLPGSATGQFSTLLVNGGYHASTDLTASAGDYWQVTGSGTTTVDGQSLWSLNDWCIYSGSAGSSSGTWRKLAFEDTIASVIVGDLSASEVFNLTGSADKQILFVTGASDSEVVMSGSNNFTFDYNISKAFLTGTMHVAGNVSGSGRGIFTDELRTVGPLNVSGNAALDGRVTIGTQLIMPDNVMIAIGSGTDARVFYDEANVDKLIISGAAGGFDIDLPDNVANAFSITEEANPYITVITTNSSEAILLSQNTWIIDDKKLYFGTNQDSLIEYDEDDQNYLIVSGSSRGMVLSGTIVAVDGKLQLSDASGLPASNGGLAAAGGQLAVSGSNIADGTIAVGNDQIVFLDADGSLKREAITDLATAMAGTGIVASSGQLELRFAEISAVTPMTSTDSVMILDNGSGTKRVTVTTMGDYLAASNGGLANTSGQLSISGSNLADATVAKTDEFIFLDADGSAKRDSISDLLAAVAGDGLDVASDQLKVNLSEVVASDGNNRLLTSDGDGTATAEANLTYDGTTFNVHDDLDITGSLSGQLSGSVEFKINMKHNNTGQFSDQIGNQFLYLVPTGVLRGPAINAVAGGNSGLGFATSGSSKARIFHDEEGGDFLVVSGSSAGLALSGSVIALDGNVILGTGTPAVDLHVKNTSNADVYIERDSGANIHLQSQASLGVIGTTTNHGLAIKTNGTQRVRVDESGLVGIATTAPEHTLSVTGTFGVGGNATLGDANTDITTVNSQLTASAGLLISDNKKLYFGNDNDASFHYDEAGVNSLVVTGAIRLNIANNSNNALKVSDLGDDYAKINSRSGNDNGFYIYKDARLSDDKKLYFGDSEEAFVSYDDGGQDLLIISGSSHGTTLSGSLVRVVDKLAVGADTNVAKTSGIFVVQADAADTTNGLIATFKSGDSDYCRINIDNTTANGDTQFTFMSNGSSKWSVGNMGSNETLHIKSGFGEFADADPFILSTSGFEFNSPVTASQHVRIEDDKKLYLGNDNDAQIEYSEGVDDLLVISGSSKGMVLSGSTIDIGGFGNAATITKLNGKVGINDFDPKVVFSTTSNYQSITFENQLTDGQGGGERLIYSPGANDTLTAGQIYFLHTDGTWDQADGSAMSTGGTQLVAVAFAGGSQQVGVLLRGFMRIPSSEILNVPGSGAVDGLPVYISTTAGHFDFTPPSSSGEFVRAVGHAIDDDSGDVLVYFNPEPIGSQIP